MDYDLPTEFDVIVIGTGIVESIVSAAASRIEKQVLHIDDNEYYGGSWASFNLETINKLPEYLNTNKHEVDLNVAKLEDGEIILPLGNENFNLTDLAQEWHVGEKEKSLNVPKIEISQDGQQEAGDNKPEEKNVTITENQENQCVITQETLLKDSKKFNIDLAPKLHYARGDFVELLISSNIARYSEFRSCSRVLTWLNGHLELVPCSRSDVFSNDKVSVIEKRMLMKLLTACLDGEQKEFEGYEEKTFKTYLKDKKLTDNLIHYVLYAIAMCDDKTPCQQGVANTKRFLDSLGRFGKTPFLYAMYGSGDIPQAFCRLSAVFGGIYALNRPNVGIIFDKDNKYKGIVCGNQRITSKNLVISVEKMPVKFIGNIKKDYISRGVFLTDRSIMESEREHLTLLLMPPEKNQNSVTVIEMGTLTGTCPKNTYLVHMFTRKSKTPKEDLQKTVEKLFMRGGEIERPKILWSFYFSVSDTNNADLKSDVPENVHICPGPDIDLDYDNSVKKGLEMFKKIYPDLEFLPRTPDPEEIIIGDESENVETEENSVKDENKQEENPTEPKNDGKVVEV